MDTSILKNLDLEQRKAVTYGSGPLLIVAGAGTGKTTVITHRIVYLIKNKKIGPQEVLALTFTDKAAGEMEERVDKLLPFGYLDLWISTFHSFCERILKDYALEIGLSSDFKLLDQTEGWLLVRRNLDKFNLDYYRPLGNPTKFIYALIEHFSRCKDEGVYPQDYLHYSDGLRLNLDDVPIGSKAIKSRDKSRLAVLQQEADRIKEVANAYHTYQRILLENNSLDFGDLIYYTFKLFKERPLILEKFREQFKYILVDEFQDTNWIQYELVKLLAAPKNNLTVCADDDQSIFQWRGASFNNVLQFRKDFLKAREIVLMHNYRACQNILDLSYKFIQLNNPNRLEYQLNQVTEISRKAKQKGVDLKNFKRISKKLKATKKGEGIIEHLHFKTLDQEINGVISKIMELLKKDKGTTFNDFAILVRTNKAAEPFCRALERIDIPYQFLASHGLYSKPIILDIISYFKLLDDYHESSAIYRLLNLPFLEIPYEDITKISKFAHQKAQSIYQTLGQLPLVGVSSKTAESVSHILGLIQKHTAIVREKNVSEVFVAFLQDSGYLDYLTKKQSAEIRQELDLINQFYDKIKQFESSHLECRLSNFMEQIGLELESGEEGPLRFDPEQGPESIKIMTLHSAKGLEFKYVFLVNLVGRHFPTTKKREPIQVPESLIKEVTPEGDIHLQEERRLFYVGMTRAKKGLFFTSAADYGGKRKKKLSRFLVELGFSDFKNKRAKPTTLFQGLESQTLFVKKKQEDMSRYLPDHFSFTQLAAFGKCPLQYKFAHILKVPVRGRAPFSFGKTMHNTLEQWVRRVVFAKAKVQETLLPGFGASDLKQESLHQSLQQGTGQAKTGFKEMLEIYEKEWRDDWYESEKQKQDYYKLGGKSLKVFYDNFVKLSPKIKIIQNAPALELNFNIKVEDYTLIGKIDRIDELKDGACEIIDYKTGGPKKKLKPEDKEQLLIYQIAAEEVLGIKPSRLSYYYLEDGSKFSFLGTDREKKKLKKKIIEDIEKIRDSDFIATPGWQCKYCDFRDICEYRSL